MGTNTLQSLSTAPALAALSARLRGVDSYYNEPESAGDLPEVIKRILANNPSLKDVKVQINPKMLGGYFPSTDTISLGVVNPAVIAHEAAHAENVRKAPLYRKILDVATAISRINNVAAIPAMLALRAFVGDPDTRREIFSILSGASAAVAAPGLVEEMSASMTGFKNSPDKVQALKTLIPAFLTHALTSSMPVGIYQFGKII
jgi:hypothetical protein